MNYSTLTKTQRRVIDAFVELNPALASSETISRQEVERLFFILFENRKDGGPKIGYPMWLVKGERVGRGVYAFPAPQLAATSKTVVSTSSAQKSRKHQEDEEFFSELAENGILAEVA